MRHCDSEQQCKNPLHVFEKERRWGRRLAIAKRSFCDTGNARTKTPAATPPARPPNRPLLFPVPDPVKAGCASAGETAPQPAESADDVTCDINRNRIHPQPDKRLAPPSDFQNIHHEIKCSQKQSAVTSGNQHVEEVQIFLITGNCRFQASRQRRRQSRTLPGKSLSAARSFYRFLTATRRTRPAGR